MEIVLIDKFGVPEESKKFLQEVHKSATLLRTLPGFVEGFVYEKTDGESRQNVVTTAVWKDEEAFQNARKSSAEEFKKIGINPQEIMKSLKVESESAVYRRSPYGKAIGQQCPRSEEAMGSRQYATATTEVESGGLSKPLNALKLLVLGATGGTGLEIVRQALERGHSVTAFVRSPVRLRPFDDRISVKQGDLLNSAELEQALKGQDVVLSGFGPRLPVSNAEAHLLEQFAVALTNAMLGAGVRRVIVESVAFLFKNSVLPPAYLLGRLFFPRTVADAFAMEQVFAKSDLDWTMVRPPELTDEPYTGKYRVRNGHLPHFGLKISRADVADFMIKVIDDRSSIQKVIGISN